MCRNYELQLQIVQLNEEDLKNQLVHMRNAIKSLKDDVTKEKDSKRELEEKFLEEAKITENKLKECSDRLETANAQVTELRGESRVMIIHLSI
jgi:predicted  nucleic acid-binding Zn-ribbon protein